jgi:hypothetical protein
VIQEAIRIEGQDKKEYEVKLSYSKGIYCEVYLNDGTVCASYVLLDNGYITQIWNSSFFNRSVRLYKLFEESLKQAIIEGRVNPSINYLYTTFSDKDERWQSFLQRGWKHEKIDSWHRFSIHVGEILKK